MPLSRDAAPGIPRAVRYKPCLPGRTAGQDGAWRRGVRLPPPAFLALAHWQSPPRCAKTSWMEDSAAPHGRAIDVFLADDNLIVREGVRALIARTPDLRVVGVAADYDEVISGCAATEPQV